MQGVIVVVDWVSRLGPTGLLALGLWALLTGKLITQGQYGAKEAEVARIAEAERAQAKALVDAKEAELQRVIIQRDRLLDLALENARLAQKMAGAKTTPSRPPPRPQQGNMP